MTSSSSRNVRPVPHRRRERHADGRGADAVRPSTRYLQLDPQSLFWLSAMLTAEWPKPGSGGSRRLLSNTQIPPVTTLRLNVSPDIAPAEIAAATSAYASLLGHSCAPTNEMTHLLPTNAASDITSGVATPPPSIHDDILTAATSTPGTCSLFRDRLRMRLRI